MRARIARTMLAGAAVSFAAAHLLPAAAGVPGLTARLPGRLARGNHHTGLALTFDDGPHPEGTPAMLDALASQDVLATFFLLAEQLRRYPSMGPRIVSAGHDIAVHGWDHTALPRQHPAATAQRLADAAAAIADICQRPPRWFRPPYGMATTAALISAGSLGLQPIWWTRWARDWGRNATATTIYARATRRLATPPEVLLLHDSDTFGHAGSWRRTAAALPKIVTHCRSLHLRVGSLTSLPRLSSTTSHSYY